MPELPEDFAKEIIAGTLSETAAKVLEAEVTKSLLAPAATEVGQLLADLTSAIRFYATDNLSRICKRWAQSRANRPLGEGELRRVMPLMQMAAMESQESLHDRWARLLDAVATDKAGAHPSFGQTLSQIRPTEATFLDHLWVHIGAQINFEATEYELKTMYVGSADGMGGNLGSKEEPYRSYYFQLMQEGTAALSNLVRMGIIDRDTMVDFSPSRRYSKPEGVRAFSRTLTKTLDEHELITTYGFSEYGKRFMHAVSDLSPGDDSD